jgi:hypothetical protein
MTPQNPDYPARVDIDYPDHLSRLLIFVKWLLAIPHYIVLWVLGIGAYVVLIVSWFAVIITGSYPQGMFNYLVGFERWRVRVSAYLFLQTDAYPPFTMADDRDYPVRVEIDYPERIARWRPLVHWLLVIPAAIGAVVIGIAAFFAWIIAWFAILITGRYPQGLWDVVTIAIRWFTRVTIFEFWMTEAYPPFVWS